MKKPKVTKTQALAACEGSMGITEHVARRLGVCRKTFFEYRRRWPEVERALQDAREQGLDFAESRLMQLIKEGNFHAISFYLERMGRERGWGVQQQVNIHGDTPVQPIICFESTPKSEESDVK